MATQAVLVDVTCAAEVFLATALLQKEQPERSEFTIQEIVHRAAKENITGRMRSGVSVHASQHCVANKAPNPAKLRMLYATGTHTRRLLLPGDDVHPERKGKIFPDPGEIPARYLPLLEWAKKRYGDDSSSTSSLSKFIAAVRGKAKTVEPNKAERWLESLFELEGLGKEHWKNVDPDEYVRQLREGWE
ncbi:MAG TPA: hypothetical protein VGG62_03935 [Terracidiphilus sp.]